MLKDNAIADQGGFSDPGDSPTTDPLATLENSLQHAPRRLVGTLNGTGSHRERDDDYRWVRIPIDARWRVIVCKEGRQYVLQYRDGPNHWTGKKFAPTKAGVHLAVRQCCDGQTYAAVRDKIEDLLI